MQLLRQLAPLLFMLPALIALEATGVDQTVSGWFYDTGAAQFPLRYNAILEIAMHQWAKQIVIVIVGCAVAVYLLTFVYPALRPQRRILLFLVLALTLAPAVVALLKALSMRHCPWSLAQYGGFAPHIGLFDAVPPGIKPGNCFPAGHASTGFCLMAFHFTGCALGRVRLARLGLWVGIGTGLALGLGRVAQGAHFLSHVLWSGLVCWTVMVVLYAGLRPRIGVARATATAARAT